MKAKSKRARILREINKTYLDNYQRPTTYTESLRLEKYMSMVTANLVAEVEKKDRAELAQQLPLF